MSVGSIVGSMTVVGGWVCGCVDLDCDYETKQYV